MRPPGLARIHETHSRGARARGVRAPRARGSAQANLPTARANGGTPLISGRKPGDYVRRPVSWGVHDIAIVIVALPSIQSELAANQSTLQVTHDDDAPVTD